MQGISLLVMLLFEKEIISVKNVDSCKNIFQWFEDCELTNELALSIELLAAFLIATFAGILAIFFYLREEKRQTMDNLRNTIRNHENSIQVMETKIIARDLIELSQKQSKIIEKQAEILLEIENKRKIRIKDTVTRLLEDFNDVSIFVKSVNSIKKNKQMTLDYLYQKIEMQHATVAPRHVTNISKKMLANIDQEKFTHLIGLPLISRIREQINRIQIDINPKLSTEILSLCNRIEHGFNFKKQKLFFSINESWGFDSLDTDVDGVISSLELLLNENNQ